MTLDKKTQQLRKQIYVLKKELKAYKTTEAKSKKKLRTVIVPDNLQTVFDEAEKNVGKYHGSLLIDPEKASIEISGQRYLLIRASALSIEFLEGIMKNYKDKGDSESLAIGKNILFDLAHLIGVEDARNFSELMGLKKPIEMLSAGPVHFAYTGWAQVKLKEGSHTTPDQNFILRYSHPYSFEADSWIQAGKKSEQSVCIMNSGYSSGWCEYSFGIKLTAVELTCRARGDDECSFIMAPPDQIMKYLKKYPLIKKVSPDVPTFLRRKIMEEKLQNSLAEKELLLKEIHHRVKNNLQIISSLLNLQLQTIEDPNIHYKFKESIDRVNSIASLHNLLYYSKTFENISVRNYFSTIVNSLKHTYNLKINVIVNVDIEMDKDELDIDTAIPCGLILNEIISNAFKYAFKGKRKGEINVKFSDKHLNAKHKYRLSINDNGVGFDKEPLIEEAKTLGLQLIDSLVNQLEGELFINTLKNKGTQFMIDF